MSSQATVHPIEEKSSYPIEPGMSNKNDGSKVALDVDEDTPERGNWSGKLDFLLSCIGYAVGLGNVWRFPYLCFRNGGGAFLIPYVIMLIFVGLPIFFLELSVGQYSQLGPLTLYKNLCPLFKGLGYTMMIATALVAIYYNMIIGWTFFYLFDSFRSDVQWQYCDHEFNTNNCFNDKDYKACVNGENGSTFLNRTCFNANVSQILNLTSIAVSERVSPPEEYLNNYMLGKTDGLHNLGGIRWELACCLVLAWIVIFFCLIKGIKSSGRVVYFTATFPYVVLFILLIRGVTLDGAYEGIKFYMIPKWEKLSEIGVWNDAAVQIFYSLSVAGGGLITLSSYNKFNNNVVRDTLIVCFANCLTSIFAGFVIFSVLGFMSVQLEVDVEDVVKGGPGLAFIVYPDAISRMPISPLWAILFFLMLFTLGLDSMFAMVENILTCVLDEFPKSRKFKPLVVLSLCAIGLVLGLPLATRGGIYVLDLMDYYGAGWPYLFCGMVECIVIGHFYGIGKFFDDVKQMVGLSPSMWAKSHLTVLFVTISPTILCFILIMSWAQHKYLKSGDYTFTDGGTAIGFIMSLTPIALIPLFAAIQLIFSHRDLTLKERFKVLITPTDVWRKAAKENGAMTSTSNGADVIRTPKYQRPYAAYDNPVAYDSPPEYETHM